MTGKAVVFMKLDVLVEVDASEDYYVMIAQAEDIAKKHVVAGNGFFPFRLATDIVQEGNTVKEMVQKLTIQPGDGWNDR